MKNPFNLEQALAGKPVVTRGGTRVDRVVSFLGVLTSTEFSVMFCAEGAIYSCKADGKMYNGHGPGSRDLFMEVEERVIWTNIYRASSESYYSRAYSTEAAANAAALIHANVRISGKAYKVVLDGGTE